MSRKIYKVLIIFFIIFIFKNVQAEELKDSLSEYISSLETYTNSGNESLNLFSVASKLKNGEGLPHKNIFTYIISSFFKEIKESINSALVIFIIIVISSLIRSIELEKRSETIAITNIICFISVATVLSNNFITMINIFKDTCLNVSSVMQIVSPFLMSLLVINGGITTVGIIQPLILFIASFTGLIISNVIIPIIILTVVFSIVGSIGENDGIEKIAKFFSKLSIWILGIMLTVFIGIMAMETTISKDVDSLAIKTTTSAVSNFVPVVGKFFSDSFENVIGASKIITKTGGIIGIIAMICIVLVPILRIIAISVIYTLISIFAEILKSDSKIVKIINCFADIYKTMFGILVANLSIFVISIGIMLNIASNIIK